MMRTVLITGANRGIGLAFCKYYLETGYHVIACSRQPEQSSDLLALKQQYQQTMNLMPLDVTRSAMMEALKHSLTGEPIDILINNAGVYGPRDFSFGQITQDQWLDTIKVNTVAPLLLTQLLVDNLAASDEKKLIMVSSKMASMADNTSGGSYIYRSSKAALNAVSKSLSHDLSAQGISVAVVHPGWVKTDMGGVNAWITTEESVQGVAQVIAALAPDNSGQFFNYDGSVISW